MLDDRAFGVGKGSSIDRSDETGVWIDGVVVCMSDGGMTGLYRGGQTVRKEQREVYFVCLKCCVD